MASSRVAKGRGRPGETVFEGRQYSDSRIAGMEAVFMEWQGGDLDGRPATAIWYFPPSVCRSLCRRDVRYATIHYCINNVHSVS